MNCRSCGETMKLTGYPDEFYVIVQLTCDSCGRVDQKVMIWCDFKEVENESEN